MSERELDKINEARKNTLKNCNEFIEKFNAAVRWQNLDEGYQADLIWDMSEEKWGCTPWEAVENHKFVNFPEDMFESLKSNVQAAMISGDVDTLSRASDILLGVDEIMKTTSQLKEKQFEIKYGG